MTIIDILEEYNIPHVGEGHRHGRPGWVQIDCPYCGPYSGKYHLGLSLATGAASCWRCGGHNAALVLATITDQKPGVISNRLKEVTPTAIMAPRRGQFCRPRGVGPLVRGHCHYLRERGLDPDRVARLWGVQGIAQSTHLPWRLYIPIIHHGLEVSWTTRSIRPDEKMRYISAPAKDEAIPHKSILYGSDYAQHAIIIHEGPVDVWATGPGAVAVCGTAYTTWQIAAMAKYPVRVICFDAEPVAQQRARALANALSVYPGTTHNVTLETGKDAAEAGPEEIEELRETFL